MNDIFAGYDEEEVKQNHEEVRTTQLIPENNDWEDNVKPNNENRTNHNDEENRQERNDGNGSENKHEAPTEDIVIKKIVDHKINRSRIHRFANVGKPISLVRWYGYETEDDTLERTKHFARSKILSNCRSRNFQFQTRVTNPTKASQKAN